MPTESAELEIPAPGGTADAFAMYPAGGDRHPGVLMYMDVIGLRPVLREMATELASHGYYVLVPNVFYRQGRAPHFPLPDMSRPEERDAFVQKMFPFMASHTVDEAVADASAYLDFLAAQEQVASGPAAVTGYCMGGVLAFRTAAARPDRVAAVASFHAGHLATTKDDSPHLQAGRIRAELHLAHAQDDAAMPPEDITRLENALDEAGVTCTSETYPGKHGFTMADTAAFSPEGLARHWERLLPLLKRTLPAG